jgi:hypothetical protein
METYDALAKLQEEDARLQIHAISTATAWNMAEIKQLTTFLFDRCPKMMHHNLAIIRGDRKNPTLEGPALQEYKDLYQYLRRLWAEREQHRTAPSSSRCCSGSSSRAPNRSASTCRAAPVC